MNKNLGTTAKQRKMAVAVAQDVLKTMRHLQVLSSNGYLRSPLEAGGFPIQDAKPAVLKKCEVCARGAMFISRCKLFNVYEFPSEGDASDMVVNSTAKDFGETNSNMIEAAFEQYNSEYGEVEDGVRAAVVFGELYDDPRKRLRAIMKNVIEHEGVFTPLADPRVRVSLEND